MHHLSSVTTTSNLFREEIHPSTSMIAEKTSAFVMNDLGQPIGLPMPDWKPPPLPPRKTMTGRYCRLEPLNVAVHAASLWESLCLDEKKANWTYLLNGPFDTFAAYVKYLESVENKDDPVPFVILLPDGKAVGTAHYMRIVPKHGCIEVGAINFSPLLQHTTAATEAMYLMMSNIFALGYRRYEWKCDSLNEPSRRAALRLGFTFEGRFRQAVVVKGRTRDTDWFSIIDKEWPVLKAGFEMWLAPANFDDNGKQRKSLAQCFPGMQGGAK